MNRRSASYMLCVSFVFILGCSDDQPKTIAKGKATFNDKPLDGATLSFVPPAGEIAAFTVTTGQDGSFEIKASDNTKVEEGVYRVTASKYALKKGSKVVLNAEEGMDIEQLKETGAVQNLLPKSYETIDGTPVTLEIKKGAMDLAVALKGPEPK